jgi:ribosomal protein L40E
MIVCSECGNAAESGDGFCASCGVLLEWSGRPVEAAAGAVDGGQPPARKPVAERDRPGPVPLVTEQVHAGPYCSACGVRNPEGRTFCRSCGETLRSGAAAQVPAPGWWRRLLNRLRGRRSYAAGDRPRGFLSHDAVPGLPAGAAATAAGHRLGAPADSHRLGAPVHSSSLGAPVHSSSLGAPVHSSSLGASGAGTRGPGAFRGTAGQRMRRAKTPLRGTLSRFAPLLLVVGLLGVGLGPARMWLTVHVFGLAHRAQVQLSQRYTNVVPIDASASSAAPGHPAKLAIDGIQQTYWLTGGGSGAGASFTVRFASPQRIDRVGVLSGEPGGDYRTQARPQTIELLVGGRSPVSLLLDDTLGFQNRPVSLRGVTAITVVIKNVYPGQNGQAVALRELEFFARV